MASAEERERRDDLMPTEIATRADSPAPLRTALSRIGIFALAVALAWGTAIPGGFVWLDHTEIEQGGYRVLNTSDLAAIWTTSLERYLERNQGQPELAGGYFRPFYALSISLDWTLWKGRAWCYHVENLVWHFAVVVGLYVVGRRILANSECAEPIAFWSVLLFAIHPLGVHSVTWISGRKDLMCAAFSLAALGAYFQVACNGLPGSPQRRGRIGFWVVTSVTCLLLAILSKELAYVVPLFASVWYGVHFRRPNLRADVDFRAGVIGLLSMWGCAAVAILYRLAVLGSLGLEARYPAVSLLENAATFARLWACYAVRALVPVNPTIVDRWRITQQFELSDLAALLACLIVISAVLAGILRGWRWTLLVLWFAIWLLPASGIVPLRHVYAERYLYPATWGLLALVVLCVFRLTSREFPAIRQALLLGATGFLAVNTARENTFWWTDESLLARAVQQDGAYCEGRIGLAILALERKEFDKVIKHSTIALESAADPTHASYFSPLVAHTNLGMAFHKLGRYDEAAEQFAQANRARPLNATTHYHLGLNALAQGRAEAAEQHFRTSLQLRPGDYLAQSNLGYAHLVQGELRDCVRLLEPLVQFHPDDMINRANLGTAYLLVEEYGKAEVQFEEIVMHQPRAAVHLAKLAWAEWKLQKRDEALRHLMTAVEIEPNQPFVRHVALMVLHQQPSGPTSSRPAP